MGRLRRVWGAGGAPGALGGDVTLSALEDGFFALLRDYGPPRPSRTSRGDGDRSRAAPAAAAALTASG